MNIKDFIHSIQFSFELWQLVSRYKSIIIRGLMFAYAFVILNCFCLILFTKKRKNTFVVIVVNRICEIQIFQSTKKLYEKLSYSAFYFVVCTCSTYKWGKDIVRMVKCIYMSL